MLDKEQCGAICGQKFLYLHAGDHVQKIERFVPHVQVCAFGKARRQRHLFFLSVGKGRDGKAEQFAFKIEFIEDRQKQSK